MSLRARLADSGGEGEVVSISPLSDARIDDIKQRLHRRLIEEYGPEFSDRADEGDDRDRLERLLKIMLDEERTPLSAADRREIVTDVADNVIGYGPIEAFLRDPDVTEIMVNNPETIFIESHGKIHESGKRFIDQGHLLRIIDKIVGQVGRRIDEAVPMVDARLPDGSRVNAIIHPLAINGPMLTIRKFSTDPYGAEDLVGFGTFTPQAREFLECCVRGRLNVLISGGTGSGKTTLLNVMSGFIPHDERIVTVEDAAELKLAQGHVLRLEARPANIEGKGEVTIRDLVRNTLRMRPDRIVVGEVRGGEALDMLQAMNTGHDGSLSTIHANSPRDALARVETMVLMAGFELPLRAIREQVSSAIDLLVHVNRFSDGSRKITQVTEVQGMEGDVILLQDVFAFDYSAGMDEKGSFLGGLKPTGIRPRFAQRLFDHGVELRSELFIEGGM